MMTVVRYHSHMPRLLAAATIRGRRLFRSRASDCAATNQGRPLFEGGVYSKKYSNSGQQLFKEIKS